MSLTADGFVWSSYIDGHASPTRTVSPGRFTGSAGRWIGRPWAQIGRVFNCGTSGFMTFAIYQPLRWSGPAWTLGRLLQDWAIGILR